MSSRGSSGPPLRGYVRNTRRRKMALDVDLNVPPSENLDQEGTSAQANSQDVQFGQQGPSVLPVPIDVEAFDDDVVISSHTAFAEAKINSGRGRNRGNTVVVDVDSGNSCFCVQSVCAFVCWLSYNSPSHDVMMCITYIIMLLIFFMLFGAHIEEASFYFG
ncbi:uncharacterized protein LOC114293368 isoform X2 [Camellia sinensis]|nr:uncharacterized protein LOC114293368 isoform X2 [Camellia sinensis]XP_028093221.1 uncharacterized protein LOC114293368 isoform X2 [Camellia sinensis]